MGIAKTGLFGAPKTLKARREMMMTRISLGAVQRAAAGGGWLQERYHTGDGQTVAEALSFRAVYGINPFEVGARHAAERAAYAARYGIVKDLLDLAPLLPRPQAALSNGERRRVILAEALLRESGTVWVDGGAGGLDAAWRRRIRAVARALKPLGVRLRVSDEGQGRDGDKALHGGGEGVDAPPPCGPVVVDMSGICVAFARRTLLKDFSWTIREGERWRLCGPNGSGKTLLLALITGDSPFAYACDIKVFGKRRGEGGTTLARMRRKIGEVSSARQSYLGVSPEAQLDDALRPGVRLLLLDEPCCDMTCDEAGRFAHRVAAWLEAHPRVAAVWVEHRPDRIPPVFNRVQTLGHDASDDSRARHAAETTGGGR